MTTNPTEALREQLQERIVDLLNGATDEIAEILRTSESGKSSFSIGVRLTLVKGRAYAKAKLNWGQRHSIETEGSVPLFDPDPAQEKLVV